ALRKECPGLFQRGPASEQQARVRSLPHVRGGGSLQGEPPDSGGRGPPSAGVRPALALTRFSAGAGCHCGGPAVRRMLLVVRWPAGLTQVTEIVSPGRNRARTTPSWS